jgi:hypothetical protein
VTAAERNASDYHTKEDLKAQLRMAQAAEAQIILSFVGAILLGFTLWFTRIAANAANEAARQTARAVSVEIRNNQCVPFVGLLATNVANVEDARSAEEVDDAGLVTITLRAKNIGKGPGILVGWSIHCETIHFLPPAPTYPHPVKTHGHIWPANEEYPLPHYLSRKASKAIVVDQATVHLWGYFLVEDVFGTVRRTGFCYQGHPFGDDPGTFTDFFWSRAGGKAYNYDREEEA